MRWHFEEHLPEAAPQERCASVQNSTRTRFFKALKRRLGVFEAAARGREACSPVYLQLALHPDRPHCRQTHYPSRTHCASTSLCSRSCVFSLEMIFIPFEAEQMPVMRGNVTQSFTCGFLCTGAGAQEWRSNRVSCFWLFSTSERPVMTWG